MERLSKENEYQRQGNQLQYTILFYYIYIYTHVSRILCKVMKGMIKKRKKIAKRIIRIKA